MSVTALATRPDQNLAAAADWSFSDLMSLGKELVGTGFLPAHIKTGAQAAAVILAGREMGLPPMRSLRSLRLIQGNVTEAADSQLARFKADGGRSDFKELTETKAVLWLRHPNADEHIETFTLEDAKRAGLVSGGGNYGKFPKAMLRSRAITAGLKSIGWNGASGVYDPSELEPAPRALAAVEPITATAQVVEEPEEKQEAAEPWPSGEIREASTPEQLEEIRARMKSAGVTSGPAVDLWKSRKREIGQ